MFLIKYLKIFWCYLKEFLESSTIHGLVYISVSRNKLTKLFWILVVITGFSIAVYLISDSFNNWSSDPYKTVVETKSIVDLRFPKGRFQKKNEKKRIFSWRGWYVDRNFSIKNFYDWKCMKIKTQLFWTKWYNMIH